MVLAYKSRLESVEEKLEVYKANESIYSQDIKIVDNYKKGLGYNAVPPPYIGNFMPPTPDLSFTGLDKFVNKPVVENRKSDEEVSKVVRKSNDSLIIEDWVSDSEEENVSQTKTEKKIVKPSIAKIEFVKPKQQEKTARKTVKQVDCNYHHKQFQKQRMVKPIWNNAQRVNHQNIAKKTHLYAKKNMVPRAVIMKSGLVSINTARQVNAAHTKTIMNVARLMSYLSKKTHLTVKRPIHKNTTFKNNNFNQRVNTVKDKNVNTIRPKAVFNVIKGNNVNVVKASACWIQVSDGLGPQKKLIFLSNVLGNLQMDLQDKGVIDSGCSRHMTGNMSYLTDYEEIDGGYVAFGRNLKEGKSQEKVPLKLLIDESQVLLRVPRKNNMYSFDLKNIVPKGGLTCLFAKATSDESKLWYRRLGHLNFKTMNKLVKGNLVRGLPSKLFENDQTCVACQKGKQHRASSTKYETSGILKSFITRIENLVDHKVKVIRCDNGTEFKNKEMNHFCEMKGILIQYSVAKTPQQNGIAKRRNRTLIKAARSMLADSKLPTTFWTEAVNTACYMQNRVLVGKPHNKTPYELFHGRTPTLRFIRPFACPITILNTIDQLGKFDGKADEGIRPDWLFEIDALTRTMNYEPIVACTQSNGFVGTKRSDNAGQARKETEPVKYYILLPLWTVDPPFSQNPKRSQDDGSKPSSGDGKKVDKDPRKDSESNDQEKEDNVNSTNNVNTVSLIVNAAGINKVNAIGAKTSIELLVDPNMPALEDYSIFDFSRDDEDDGAEADMNNLDTTIRVSPNLTIKIHKDHPLDQVIRDFQSAAQTRMLSKNLKEHGFVSTIQQRTNHKDLQNCLFACFLSQEEPKKVIHALKDPSWIEAMQEELLQFKLQEV
ncbi:putative ribonuclease H-like domain-containing protein [Tanacetum coccineum]